jgi:hypothetical protein
MHEGFPCGYVGAQLCMVCKLLARCIFDIQVVLQSYLLVAVLTATEIL